MAVAPLVAQGYGAVLPEYPGYNGAAGEPGEQPLYAAARAVRAWMAGQGIAPQQTVLLGYSIGSGVAVQMALESRPRGLILVSPHAGLVAMAQHRLPLVPARWLLHDRYDNLAKIRRIDAPILIIHGSADPVVPWRFGAELAAAQPHATFLTIRGGDHAIVWTDTVARDIAGWLANLQSSAPVQSAAPVSTSILACRADIGAVAADHLVARCRAVSPATHPPCNVANSCALIGDEIARSCALLGDAAAGTPACAGLTDEAARARDVVERYYAAINARDYGTAYALWGDSGGASGQRFEAFRAGFAETRSVHVIIGQGGTVEGAAGSLYADLPVIITAELADGRVQHFAGNYQLRRVNDVEGASQAALRWHIASAHLQPTKG